MKVLLSTSMLIVLPAALEPTPAGAEVVSRTLQASVEFAERYGASERAKTPSDARLQLYEETAEECRRLEKMSGLACRVDNLTLRMDARDGRPALIGSVRFLLRSLGDEAAKTPPPSDARSDGQPGAPR